MYQFPREIIKFCLGYFPKPVVVIQNQTQAVPVEGCSTPHMTLMFKLLVSVSYLPIYVVHYNTLIIKKRFNFAENKHAPVQEKRFAQGALLEKQM